MTSKFLLVAVLFIAFLVVAQRKGWIDLTNDDRPATGNALGVFDEIFSPSRHQAQVQKVEQKELRAEVSNADPNKIHIELSEK